MDFNQVLNSAQNNAVVLESHNLKVDLELGINEVSITVTDNNKNTERIIASINDGETVLDIQVNEVSTQQTSHSTNFGVSSDMWRWRMDVLDRHAQF